MESAASWRRLLEKRGFVLSMTYGRSMRPLIWGGRHCVAVVPLEGEPQAGDLLLFRGRLCGREGNIVHRLVETREEGGRPLYITRGDNCLRGECVRRRQIIGRVAEVHRIAGYRPWYAVAGKKFSVTDAAYLRYSRFWERLWPLRREYYRVRECAGALRARIMTKLRKER